MTTVHEILRLQDARDRNVSWKKWGPYLSERQWGTVREDYSEDGDAWNYFTHDQARSRAYRWGEDGIAGISDDKQRLCFALALWNGQDPILKERLFGLTNSEGNHGEDVKEYYFYLDSTPTHSYMKYLYKYPQRPIPTRDLVDDQPAAQPRASSSTSCSTPASSTTTATSTCSSSTPRSPRGHPDPDHASQPRPRGRASCTCCRRSGSATPGRPGRTAQRDRSLQQVDGTHDRGRSSTSCGRFAVCLRRGHVPLLFTENETNNQRLFGMPNSHPLRQGRHQ